MKRLIILVMCCLYLAPGPSHGGDFYEAQLDRGIRNSETYSHLLIEKARENESEAMSILEKALTHSPDLPAVYFALAKASLAQLPGGIVQSIGYLFEGVRAYFRNFWWSFTLIGSLYYSLVISFLLSIALMSILGLLNTIALVGHDIQETASKAFFMLVLILLSAVSPLFLLAGVFILIGMYMSKSDQLIVYLFLLFLVVLPLVVKMASLFLDGFSSGTIKSVVEVNEYKGNDYALSTLKASEEYAARFSYALALKRSGNYHEAIGIYEKLIEEKPDPKLYINLANCHVGLNNYDEAIKLYTKAIEMEHRASAFYNTSQLLREMLDFKKGNEYFMSAVSLDRGAIAEFRSFYGRTPNRLVADETLTRPELWKYIKEKSTARLPFAFSIVPVPIISVIALILIAAFFVLNTKIKNKAIRCKRCYTVICTKCEKHLMWGETCPQCYKSLVKITGIDAQARSARLLAIHALQNKRRIKMKILSFILPGAPQVYAGRTFFGFVLLWPFLFFLLIPFANYFYAHGPTVSHNFFSSLAVISAIGWYVIAHLVTRKLTV